MINIAICDDELYHRESIKEIVLKKLKLNNINHEIYEYESGEDLLSNYPKNIDILIMDIQMKLINGMDTARKIREFDSNVEIIFMTSFAEFMQEGYEVRAYRYLLKPVSEDQIKKHLIPCINDIKKDKDSYLNITNKNYIDRIKISSIIYVETIRPNILISTKDRDYVVNMSMSKIESILKEYDFFRCHNSYIVNLRLIDSMRGNILILNDKEIPISKYRVKSLKLEMANVLGDILC